ncbi:MAG: GDP-L-fucose synthase [Desulfobacterales bacterium]|jgi:GDP-L-fucose synthase|nr:GDP-L-fucose synthase [Desulfobacterales bacterium]
MTKSQTQVSDPQRYSGILNQDSRIFLAGHQGMVGSAIYRYLQGENYRNIITRSHDELDLVDQAAVRYFFQNEKIDVVILAAAKVGGIHANDMYRAEFIFENIMIQANVIHEAYRSGVKRLLFLGSSCIYPKYAAQPMREEQLLTGRLEPTNEPYAIAKIAGIKLCESYNFQYGTHYRSVMPTNLYGPNDNFDLENSHVLPAMIRKFHLAKLARGGDWESIQKDQALFGPISVDFLNRLKALPQSKAPESQQSSAIRLWGSGHPKREFLHVDDLASACLFLCNLGDDAYAAACAVPLEQPDQPKHKALSASANSDRKDRNRVSHINVGSGKDIHIAELAEVVQEVVDYEGAVSWNTSMPDGTPRKLLDISRLTQLGWKPRISLSQGIKSTYKWYLAQSELDSC